MLIVTSCIYQPKIKCKDGGSNFYKNKKYRRLEKEKKIVPVISFHKFLIFPIWAFSENAQSFPGAFL